MNQRYQKALRDWAQILLGLLSCTAAYRMMLIPGDIAPGGFTGIAQLINHSTGWPIGTITLCLNIPLFALSARLLGVRFGIRSLITTVLLSLMIDYLPIPPLLEGRTGNPMLLNSVFGGVLGGIGFGFILRGNATTGGSDMLGKLINRRLSFISVGMTMFAVDFAVIIASGYVFGAESALFALLCTYLMSRVIDQVVDGLNAARAYFIISDHAVEISVYIMQSLERGVTALDGRGVYSGERRQILLCVVSRAESIQLRACVARIDPKAFVFAAPVYEALGEGFTPHTPTRAKSANPPTQE